MTCSTNALGVQSGQGVCYTQNWPCGAFPVALLAAGVECGLVVRRMASHKRVSAWLVGCFSLDGLMARSIGSPMCFSLVYTRLECRKKGHRSRFQGEHLRPQHQISVS